MKHRWLGRWRASFDSCTNAGPSCRGLAYPGELRAAVLASLPEWVRAADQPAPARLRVDDIECTIDTIIVKREPIASTYVASYRQVNNPRFSLLQDQLRGIQDELSRGDLNASFREYTGFSAGDPRPQLRKRASDVAAQLRETSPSTTYPVTRAYQAERITATDTARITGRIQLIEEQDAASQVTHFSGAASANSGGMRNVLAGDVMGLRNRVPNAGRPSALIASALAQLTQALEATARSLGEQVFIEKATRAFTERGDVASAIGNLLLAEDFNAEPSGLGDYAALLAAARTGTFEDLPDLESQLSSAVAPAPARAPSTGSPR